MLINSSLNIRRSTYIKALVLEFDYLDLIHHYLQLVKISRKKENKGVLFIFIFCIKIIDYHLYLNILKKLLNQRQFNQLNPCFLS